MQRLSNVSTSYIKMGISKWKMLTVMQSTDTVNLILWSITLFIMNAPPSQAFLHHGSLPAVEPTHVLILGSSESCISHIQSTLL